jgi:hypothetical protein
MLAEPGNGADSASLNEGGPRSRNTVPSNPSRKLSLIETTIVFGGSPPGGGAWTNAPGAAFALGTPRK